MSQEAKPAAQKRSQVTRDRLINALEELLREKFFDQITVAEIAGRAGVAVGTVYRRFKNKEAFIPVMLEQHRLRQEALLENPDECLEIAEGATLREALKEMALYAAKQVKREGHVLRTLYLYARVKPEIIGSEWDLLEEQALDQIKTLLAHYKDDIKRADPDLTAAMTLYFTSVIFIEKGLFPELSPVWMSKIDLDQFANEIAGLCVRISYYRGLISREFYYYVGSDRSVLNR